MIKFNNMKIYNTLFRKKQIFKPLNDKKVGFYTCGPTVYWFAHIGNLRTYIFEDIFKRALKYNNYKVRHIMNITDVGHLTSDADTGEDKMEKRALTEKKSVAQIAEFYTKAFKKDLKFLNILPPDLWIKATDVIKEQIDLIKILEKKGYAYRTSDGIYFNTSKLKKYGALGLEENKKMKTRARVKIIKDKRNLTDFALWKFSPVGAQRQMEWNSPWGKGFPGWHTECVVMSIKELGIPFDIHCGGIDHISIHHPNEIAQAQAVYGKPLARYWAHGEFLSLKKEKMAKSDGNIIIIDDLIKKDINPLAYRYLSLNTHYRARLIFSWEALKSAENSLNNLYQKTREIKTKNTALDIKARVYQKKFLEFINDDLNMPKALALMWIALKDKKLSENQKYNLLIDFDKIFGLGLKEIKKQKTAKIPDEISKMAEKREAFRKNKQWELADKIRKQIEKMGYEIEDTEKGYKLKTLKK